MELEPGSVIELQEVVNVKDVKSLWVFGYGSLCWNPGFYFEKAVTGYIQGYSRKFWQGNTTHRGTEENSLVHGVAFKITEDTALNYLSNRECKLGGYTAEFTTFYPISKGSPFTAILYMATPKNSLWMGDAPLPDIADQITNCSGPSGHNIEYLLRLANFMRNHFPEEYDDHLFGLELLVRRTIKDRKMCLRTVMGDESRIVTFVRRGPLLARSAEEQDGRVDSFQFTTRVPEKTLRCLNI